MHLRAPNHSKEMAHRRGTDNWDKDTKTDEEVVKSDSLPLCSITDGPGIVPPLSLLKEFS